MSASTDGKFKRICRYTRWSVAGDGRPPGIRHHIIVADMGRDRLIFAGSPRNCGRGRAGGVYVFAAKLEELEDIGFAPVWRVLGIYNTVCWGQGASDGTERYLRLERYEQRQKVLSTASTAAPMRRRSESMAAPEKKPQKRGIIPQLGVERNKVLMVIGKNQRQRCAAQWSPST